MRLRRLPGLRQGIPRYRRAGQIALDLPGTLDVKLEVEKPTVVDLRAPARCVLCLDRGCEFCPMADEDEDDAGELLFLDR